jgi:hypothetical protein
MSVLVRIKEKMVQIAKKGVCGIITLLILQNPILRITSEEVCTISMLPY